MPTQILPNNLTLHHRTVHPSATTISKQDEQRWFQLDAKPGVKYRVTVALDKEEGALRDSVVCRYSVPEQNITGGQALDVKGDSCNDDDSAGSLGSRLEFNGIPGRADVAGPQYITVYGQRKDELGYFSIAVATGCDQPLGELSKVKGEPDAETSRYYFLRPDGESVDKGWFLDDNGETSQEPCKSKFVGDPCKYKCAPGYVAAGTYIIIDL